MGLNKEKLADNLYELQYQLKMSKDKELIYKDILSNIEISIKELFQRETENERFNLGDEINFRESMVNLKNSLEEYKRLYKLRF
jgi:UTP-glucose-1-phosphate uridylyltransferase